MGIFHTTMAKVAVCILTISVFDLKMAVACEVERIFSGSTILSKAQIPPGKDDLGYDYYLVLNDDRDQNGILNSFIKAKLVPARWGFDIQNPKGELLGQVMIHVRDSKLPKGTFEVTMDHDQSCPKTSIFFVQINRTDVSVRLQNKVIGKIENRYSEVFK